MKKGLLTAALIGAFNFLGQAEGLKNLTSGSILTNNATFNGGVECSYADNNGNFYIAGASKEPNSDFDCFNLFYQPAGTTGFYFYFNKYNSAGVMQFSKLLTTTSTSTSTNIGIRGITADASGNVYITGTFDATVDFDPSGLTSNLTSTTGKTFLAKYDNSGSLVWAKNFGGLSSSSNTIVPEDVAINPTNGKIFIAGWYIGNTAPVVDFDPGTANTNTYGMLGAHCGFFASYNPADGSYVTNSQWAAINNTYTSTDHVEIKHIAFDNANNIYAVGYFKNTLVSTGGLNIPYTNQNGFIVKKPATSAGNTQDDIATAIGIYAYDISIDASNNVYVGGDIGTSGMVAKYNSSLVQSWLKYPNTIINSIDLNSANQLYAVGGGGVFAQLYNSNGGTVFGTNGLQIPNSSGFLQTYTKEVKVIGNNVLIGGDLTYSGSTYGSQDIGFNYDTILVGNNAIYKRQFWGIYVLDLVGPLGTITTTASDPTTVSPIPLTITFDEKVQGLTVGAFYSGNGDITNLVQINDSTFTADLTPLSAGIVDCNLDPTGYYDYQNNLGQGAYYFSTTYNQPDVTPPNVVITSTSSNPTNVSPIPVTFTFSENVTGFTVTDISVTNGTAGNFAGSGSIYTADITPTTQGTVTISVAANVCVDGASNQNTASNTLTRTFDSANPTVVVSSISSNPTNVSPIPVTFTFSENVTGFTVTDISLTNGTTGNFAGSGSIYTADITPTTQGTVTVNVAANVCIDVASNQNTASNTLTRTFDNINPTVVISSAASNPTVISPIPVSITFSEPVLGFDISDLTVGNGIASNFAGSGNAYTADITPTSAGIVTVDITGSACFDNANNANAVANQFSITFQTTGITTFQDNHQITVFPNPSNGKITIKLPQQGLLEIYNLLGEKILEKTVNSIQTTQELLLQKEGNYIGKFSTNNKIEYVKFIITK